MKTNSQRFFLAVFILIVIVSTADASSAKNRILSIEKTLSTVADPEYLGKYTFVQQGQEMVITISSLKEKLVLKISSEPTSVYYLDPVSGKKDEFTVSEGGKEVAKLTFQRNNKQVVKSFLFMQGQGKYEWKKKKS